MAIGLVVRYHRKWPATWATVDYVGRSNYPAANLLVVDHASGDQTAQELRTLGLDVLELGRNRGCAGGMRAGFVASAFTAPSNQVCAYPAVRAGIRLWLLTVDSQRSARLIARVTFGAIRDMRRQITRSAARRRFTGPRDGWTGRFSTCAGIERKHRTSW